MKPSIACLLGLSCLLLTSPIMSQEPVTDTISNEKSDYDRIDSLHMKIDSLLMKDYGIKPQTNEKGEKLHTAIGSKASNLGVGLELTMAFNEKFSLRFSGTYYQFESESTEGWDEPVGIDVAHESLGGGAYLLADYQFIKFMHATAGIIYKVAKESGTAHPTSGVTVGGIEIPADIVGQISYAIEQKSIGYYAGVGFGRTISLKKRVAFSASLGGYYIPAQTKVKIEASEMLSPTASIATKKAVEQNVGNQQFYPFISIQFSYRLN